MNPVYLHATAPIKPPILILDFDNTIAYTYNNGITIFRPYIMEFIERMSKKYTLIIWTAGSLNYILPRLREV